MAEILRSHNPSMISPTLKINNRFRKTQLSSWVTGGIARRRRDGGRYYPFKKKMEGTVYVCILSLILFDCVENSLC